MTEHNLQLTRAYLAALQARAPSALDYYAPDAIQRELPNRLNPTGAVRDLPALQASHQRGRQTVTQERYDILSLVASGDQVAAEVLWSARLANPLATRPAGTPLKAHLAIFLTWRDGKIISQRSYDCFEPF